MFDAGLMNDCCLFGCWFGVCYWIVVGLLLLGWWFGVGLVSVCCWFVVGLLSVRCWFIVCLLFVCRCFLDGSTLFVDGFVVGLLLVCVVCLALLLVMGLFVGFGVRLSIVCCWCVVGFALVCYWCDVCMVLVRPWFVVCLLLVWCLFVVGLLLFCC